MASKGIRISLVLALVAVACGGAMAQPICSSALTSLAPCLNYITGNSTSPSSSCCTQLGNVVQASPQCLCSIFNNNFPSIGITINQTLALNLPGACKVQTPPITQCKAATAPAPTTSVTPPESSPASSPADSSNPAPEPAVTPSAPGIPSASGTGTGSKTVPSTTGTSDGSIVKAPLHFVLFILFMAWCGSTVTQF